jgi:hypothetical protein
MRHWFRRAIDEGRLDARSPVASDSHFFDQPDEEIAGKGMTLTRFMYQFWLNRRDLREAFDIFTPRGYTGYFEWFLGGDAQRQGVDGRSIAAARQLCGGTELEFASAAVEHGEPPWPSVSRRAWQGPSYEAAQFLKGDVMAQAGGKRLLVPVQIALVWELRADLQSHFRLRTIDDLHSFLAWAVTSGVTEGMVRCDEFSPEFLMQMSEELSTTSYYRDVPITPALVATRFVAFDNKCYTHRHRFPVERAGRLAHGLWFAYIAPRRFKWPKELVAPLLAYFEAPAAIELDGFRLTNAMLAIWGLRDDIQRTYHLDTEASIGGYIVWLLTYGLRELEISLDQLGAGVRDFLLTGSPRRPGVERILAMLYETRGDLQQQFDITTERGRNALRSWWWNDAVDTGDDQAATALIGQSDAEETQPDAPVHRARVALTGQWSAPTGRGEEGMRCLRLAPSLRGVRPGPSRGHVAWPSHHPDGIFRHK